MTALSINYSKCNGCGRVFLAGEHLVAMVVQAEAEGDTLLQFVHQQCLPVPPAPARRVQRP